MGKTRARSIDDFVHHVLNERCKEVEIVPTHENKGLVGVPGVSLGALSSSPEDDVSGEEYYLRYIAHIPSGGSIVHEGERIGRYMTLDVAAQDHEREALKLFLEAEKSARDLHERLGTVHVNVVFEPGIPIGAARLRELYARAGEYGLLPPK
ncbi:hypothetical protein HY839_03135 [Candidatus Azambacteria bacterium]|nr:hypothetical protein [Candidatus Azambacteria bacterium]